MDIDVQMASETQSICPMPNGPRLHLPGPAEAGHNAGRVSGGSQTWTWLIMSPDDHRQRGTQGVGVEGCTAE